MWVVIIFLPLYFSSSLSQVTVLEQVSPKEGDPICLGDKLVYSCTVQASQLTWAYTGEGGSTHTFLATHTTIINQPFFLGAFDVFLLNISSPDDPVLVSTAMSRNGLTTDISGQTISCSGTPPQFRNIIFTELKIENATVCLSTIYWSPPLCDANCTVSVDGQDIETVTCSNGSLNIDVSDVSNKTVTIVATDLSGKMVNITASEDCTGPIISSTEELSTKTPVAEMSSTPATAVIIGPVVAVIVVGLIILVLVMLIIISFIIVSLQRRKGRMQMEKSRTDNSSQGRPRHSKPFSVTFQATYTEHKHPITHCAVSSDAMYVATADTNMVLWIWKTGSDESESIDITKAKLVTKPKSATDSSTNYMPFLPEHLERLVSLTWVNKSNKRQLMLAYPKCVMIWDMSNSTIYTVFETQKFKKHTVKNFLSDPELRIFCAACSAACHSPHSSFAVSFTDHFEKESVVGYVLLGSIDYSPHQDYHHLDREVTPVVSMSFSPSGKQLVTGNVNGEICVYDLIYRKHLTTWKAHEQLVYDVQFAVHDKSLVCSVGEDQKFCLWEMSETSSPRHSENVVIHPDPSYSVLKKHGTFQYLCRSKLFAAVFANQDMYILANSPESEIIYQVDCEFKLLKVEFKKLHSGKFVTCVDWVRHDDITTCVMGYADNSVKVMQLRPKFEPKSFKKTQENKDHHHNVEQEKSFPQEEQPSVEAAQATPPTTKLSQRSKDGEVSLLPNGKGRENVQFSKASPSTIKGQHNTGVGSAMPQTSQQSARNGKVSPAKVKENKEVEGVCALPSGTQPTTEDEKAWLVKQNKSNMEKGKAFSSKAKEQLKAEAENKSSPTNGGQHSTATDSASSPLQQSARDGKTSPAAKKKNKESGTQLTPEGEKASLVDKSKRNMEKDKACTSKGKEQQKEEDEKGSSPTKGDQHRTTTENTSSPPLQMNARKEQQSLKPDKELPLTGEVRHIAEDKRKLLHESTDL